MIKKSQRPGWISGQNWISVGRLLYSFSQSETYKSTSIYHINDYINDYNNDYDIDHNNDYNNDKNQDHNYDHDNDHWSWP